MARTVFHDDIFEKDTFMNQKQLKPFAWGAAAGAVTLAIVMFSTGLAVTSVSAEKNAKMMSQAAVVENLASICVAQFEGTADRQDKLDKLAATDSWNRPGFVSEQGWATMPGSDTPAAYQVASECAVRLAKLQG